MRHALFPFPSKLLTVAMVILVVAGCGNSTTTESDGSVHLQDLELTKLDGTALDMGAFEGKKVFVNFWATWCKPCLEEMPSIARARKELQGQDVIFLMASAESTETIVKFKNARNFDLDYFQLKNMDELQLQALPTTFIFNGQGVLVYSDIGYKLWDKPENLSIIVHPEQAEKTQ